MSEAFPVLIAEVGKNRGSAINIALNEFKGLHLVDLRTYVGGQATKRGICVQIGKLSELRDALAAAEAKARAIGWLDVEGGADE